MTHRRAAIIAVEIGMALCAVSAVAGAVLFVVGALWGVYLTVGGALVWMPLISVLRRLGGIPVSSDAEDRGVR